MGAGIPLINVASKRGIIRVTCAIVGNGSALRTSSPQSWSLRLPILRRPGALCVEERNHPVNHPRFLLSNSRVGPIRSIDAVDLWSVLGNPPAAATARAMRPYEVER